MLDLTNPHNFYRLGCRKKSLSQPFFRFGFGASRSILSRFFDLNGFTLLYSHDRLISVGLNFRTVYFLGCLFWNSPFFGPSSMSVTYSFIHENINLVESSLKPWRHKLEARLKFFYELDLWICEPPFRDSRF